MAAIDAHYQFITDYVGGMGRFIDGNLFSNSTSGQMMLNKSLKLPQPKK